MKALKGRKTEAAIATAALTSISAIQFGVDDPLPVPEKMVVHAAPSKSVTPVQPAPKSERNPDLVIQVELIKHGSQVLVAFFGMSGMVFSAWIKRKKKKGSLSS